MLPNAGSIDGATKGVPCSRSRRIQPFQRPRLQAKPCTSSTPVPPPAGRKSGSAHSRHGWRQENASSLATTSRRQARSSWPHVGRASPRFTQRSCRKPSASTAACSPSVNTPHSTPKRQPTHSASASRAMHQILCSLPFIGPV
jgi:hypothetical protein